MRMKRLLGVLALGLVLSLAGISPASAILPNTLYTDAGTALYTLDAGTGVATLVGGTGRTLTDIAFDGNKLFGVDFNTVYSVNPNTGATTALATIPYPSNALAAQGGTLWAVQYNTGLVYTINEANPLIQTNIGNFGGGLQSGGDLAFQPGTGQLYGVVTPDNFTSFYVAMINQATGVASPLANPTGFPWTFGISFRNGIMYGVGGNGHVFTVDLGNNPLTQGQGTLISNNGLPMYGLTTSPTPLPSTVLLLGGGLLGLVGLGWRVRKN